MYKNGGLPVVLTQAEVDTLAEDARAGKEIEIDLPSQTVVRSNGEKFSFEVDAFRKHCLVNGLDEIQLTLEKEAEIKKFEDRRKTEAPWLDGKMVKPGKIPVHMPTHGKEIKDW